MRRLILALAIAGSLGVASPSRAAFSLSSVTDFLAGLNLPEHAQQAADKVAAHVQTALDRVGSDLGGLDGYELPDVDQIVQDVRDHAEEALAKARSHAQSVLDGLDLPDYLSDLPNFELPSYEAPDVDAILEEALARSESAASDALQHAADALQQQRQRLESLDALDGLQGPIGDAFDRAQGVIDELLSETPGVQEAAAASLSLEPAALQVAAVSFNAATPVVRPLQAATATPEPATVVAAASGLVVALAGRRRR